MKHSLTVTSGAGVDVTLEARKICDFLFAKCNGNVSEAAVLMFLRRCQNEHEAHPHTKAAVSDAMLRACEAAGA